MPRYREVAQALIADIEQGRVKVGDLLPPETEIAREHGVSRHTAREAFRRLDELGLITRRAGVGTIVKAGTTQTQYTATISDLADLVHYTRNTRLQIMGEEWVTVSGALGKVIPQASGQRWLKFTTMRYPTGAAQAISYTEIVVHPLFERIRERIHQPKATVYRLIEELHGQPIREVRQEIDCIAIGARVATLLGVRARTPALRVLRYYLGRADQLLSVSINVYPQDRFRLTTRWRRDLGSSNPLRG